MYLLKRITQSHRALLTLPLLLLPACASVHDFTMGDSNQQLKRVQILDPDAALRNDGLILSLEGNYGQKVMASYRDSSVVPATAQAAAMTRSIMSN